MDSELRESLAVEFDALLVELVDEDAVLATCSANSCVQTDNPERAEIALLFFAVHVGVLTCFDDTLFSVDEGFTTLTLIALGELLDLLVPTVADGAALYSHNREGSGWLSV